MRVVVAPDKFKGSLSAHEVATALARAVERSLPEADVAVFPMADGGEGTLEALTSAVDARVLHAEVSGPLGGPVRAPVVLLPDGTAALEMASASGLALVEQHERDALRATSRGTGQLALRAAQALVRVNSAGRVIVGIGGSASTDGGVGAAGAVGWRFLDRLGHDLPPGGGSLHELVAIDGSDVSSAIAQCAFVGACDVDNPLLGEDGAARVFAPQKGASAADVQQLSEGLEALAERIDVDLGIDVRTGSHTGAGGGFGAGLVAFFGGVLTPGTQFVANAIGLTEAIEQADLVITGEGRVDGSSLRGKTPVGVAQIASRASVPCWLVAGEVAVPRLTLAACGIQAVVALSEQAHSSVAAADARRLLTERTAQLLRERYT